MIALSGTALGQQLKLTRTECIHHITASRARFPLMSMADLSTEGAAMESCYDTLNGSSWQEDAVAHDLLIKSGLLHRLRDFINTEQLTRLRDFIDKHWFSTQLQTEAEIRPRSK